VFALAKPRNDQCGLSNRREDIAKLNQRAKQPRRGEAGIQKLLPARGSARLFSTPPLLRCHCRSSIFYAAVCFPVSQFLTNPRFLLLFSLLIVAVRIVQGILHCCLHRLRPLPSSPFNSFSVALLFSSERSGVH